MYSPLLQLRRRAGLILLLALTSTASAASATAELSLIEAVRKRQTAEWQARLKAKPDLAVRDAAGNTALHWAALTHDLTAVNALVAAGAEVDAVNAAGATPLLYGAAHPGIVRALLARGANPNASSALKNTPLMVATAYPHALESVRLLVDAGADLHAKKVPDYEIPLARAASASDRETVEFLVARGAAKDATTAAAALSFAAGNGEKEIVQLLLQNGADPNLNPVFAGHALNTALLNQQLEVARLLIEHGANPNLRSPDGNGTPTLVLSAYNQIGDASVARALLSRGVDVNVANDHGMTALTYALRSGHDTPLVAFLREAGAKSNQPVRSKQVPNRAMPEGLDARAALVRERVPAMLHLLQRSSDAFLENRFVQQSKCTSCHGQDLPAVALAMARERGFAIDDVSVGRQLNAQFTRWADRAEAARQLTSPIPGAPVTIAYGLFGARALGYPADDTTDAMVHYILRTQRPDGSWNDFIRRPPIEDGQFVSTAWVALAVRDYAPAGYEREAAESQARTAAWLQAREPASNNETVFQLLGLHWSGVPRAGLEASFQRVIHAQRADGGWAQLPGLDSDAWATGTALYALHEAGRMPTSDPVYQRGVAFLLRTQFEDGSWWVRGRSWPFQPHFNGQFPHGKDQWISQASTAWATMALLLTLDRAPASKPPTPQSLIALYRNSAAAKSPPKAAEANSPAESPKTIDFARDIHPILERSCTGCHGGDKPRGNFALISRDALLKGGASGEPAVTPGYADDSTLIQYVTGKIEDLEMPPLNRREKYPALAASEVDLLRSWIDAGAPWPKDAVRE